MSELSNVQEARINALRASKPIQVLGGSVQLKPNEKDHDQNFYKFLQ